MSEVFISVVVCTYNRAFYIQKTIESLLHQSLEKDCYEIIVIDNASTDHTARVLSRYKDIRYIYEPKQGLSLARNMGIAHSKGEIVAYIDDDAIASKNWLENIVKAFSMDPEIAAVGGKINPLWEIKKPEWITPQLYTYFSCIDWSPHAIYLRRGRFLFGCNMAIKKSVLIECGGFSNDIGRIGGNLLSNEEWHVFKYIDKKMLKKYYDPAICVDHIVLKHRISWKWLNQRLYWQGVSNLYYDYFIEKLTNTKILKKYFREMSNAAKKELMRLRNGTINKIYIGLLVSRYTGFLVHFMKIAFRRPAKQ